MEKFLSASNDEKLAEVASKIEMILINVWAYLNFIKFNLDKSKRSPPIPKTVDDIVLKDEWTLCKDGNRRFLVQRDEQQKCSSIIFSSDIGLKILSES